MRRGGVVVLGPSPLLEVSIEPSDAGPTIRLIPGGQGVWVARMAATMGAEVTLCGLSGGATGSTLAPMLGDAPYACVLVPTAGPAGCFVVDQRHEPATEVASRWAPPPSTTEVEALLAAALDACEQADVLVVGNPMPGDALARDVYTRVVAAARARDVAVVVDLSSPRVEAAVRGGPATAKLNDWELAELVTAPVGTPHDRGAAIHRLLDLGATSVVVTRGASTVFAVDERGSGTELTPPRVGVGRAAGCGDAMTGALAAMLAQGADWLDAVALGMAAGAAHYAGRDETSRTAIEALARQVSRRRVRL